ncbi:MAG: DUF4332 domain-containing protein [Bacteroides sp.]|nr:DUF4332 domain-containing protein [Bacteroidales bacterium]MBD5379128.1 DUF4332 domain-containing protein [Bacteroides sp.]MDE5808720.1 DUF4332 domain-containing protein [Muribaculaceae bacterium]MDE6225327.1 DUF4332 domain-containing protein [Muribaculaceae bacterium]
MIYKVIDIEGVGPAYAEKLNAAGIESAKQYLEIAATPKGRQQIADQTGISPALILKWANHCDLYRVKGIGPQFAELLEASGVDTVKELRHRKPENLAETMVKVNEQKKLVRRVPTAGELRRMIDQAATLPPVMTY